MPIKDSDLQWLLANLRKMMRLTENSLISGIKTNPKLKEEAIGIDLFARYLMEDQKKGTDVFYGLFRRLLVSTRSGVLSKLLLKERPLKFDDLRDDSTISNRGLRRELALLEKVGVLTRVWHNGIRGVQLKENWRNNFREL